MAAKQDPLTQAAGSVVMVKHHKPLLDESGNLCYTGYQAAGARTGAGDLGVQADGLRSPIAVHRLPG